MARFIDLDSLDANTALWIMPERLIHFDQRDPPWPNELWRWSHSLATNHPLFDQDEMVLLRRWCERELRGDVVARFHTEQIYNDTVTFYFDNTADHLQFHDRFGDRIIHSHDPILG
jgi:hypothetical protein